MLASLPNKGTKMLDVVTLQAKYYYIVRSEICYIIDWGFHIIAIGSIRTKG